MWYNELRRRPDCTPEKGGAMMTAARKKLNRFLKKGNEKLRKIMKKVRISW